MTHVEGFDSLDDMFAAMGVAEDAANADLLPGQIQLRDDVTTRRYWAHPLPEIDLIVYGVTPPIAEIQPDAGFDVAENRARGYLTGTGYSPAVSSRGEPGDTHVSQVVPISEETFRLAESLNWPTWSMMMEPEQRDLGRALARHEADSLCRI